MTAALLLAEPESAIRGYLERQLQSDGFHVLQAAFGGEALALAERNRPDLVLCSELELCARLRQGEDSPDLDSASAMFRSLIVRLGDGAAAGAETHVIDELVGGLVEARDTARASRDFATADRIRDRLAAAGVEVRDGSDGSTWVLADGRQGGEAVSEDAAGART